MILATDITPIVQVNVAILGFVAGPLAALVTAVLTKASASAGVKAVVNVVLSIVGGVAAYLIAHDGSASVLAIATVAIETYLASGVTYNHFLKPTGIAPAVTKATAGVGLG